MEDAVVKLITICTHVHRNSLRVMTLEKECLYNAIDEPFIENINNWLSRGMSVTHVQGSELANSLLKQKRLERNNTGDEIQLDAIWWPTFMQHNKKQLICSYDEDYFLAYLSQFSMLSEFPFLC